MGAQRAYSWPEDNIEFCDYCNRPDVQNAAGGSGLLDAEGHGGISTYTNGAYGNCYWDKAGGGCRANGSIDANRIRKQLGVARYLDKGYLAEAKMIWIFWGEEWKSQTNPSRTDILRNYALLDTTPYYQPLSQYNINKPTYFMDIIYDNPEYPPEVNYRIFRKSVDPSGNPNDARNIITLIAYYFLEGKVPTPGTQEEFMYLVMLPQGFISDGIVDMGARY
jgi:hypothetical protein